MSALVTLVLLPTPQISKTFDRLPNIAALGGPGILEIQTASGSPMPQEKISYSRLLTPQNAPMAGEITEAHPLLGDQIGGLHQTEPEDLLAAMVIWNLWSLGDEANDRLSQCTQWRRQFARTFITYQGLNGGQQDFIRIGSLRGKLDNHLEQAISSFNDHDEVQVFILRTDAGISNHQLLAISDWLQEDLTLWAAWLGNGRRITAPILQTSRSTHVRLAPISSQPPGAFPGMRRAS